MKYDVCVSYYKKGWESALSIGTATTVKMAERIARKKWQYMKPVEFSDPFDISLDGWHIIKAFENKDPEVYIYIFEYV